MQKIWAKIMLDGRVKKGIIHDAGERVTVANFYDNIRGIAEKMGIPTPVVLNTYAENFLTYNIHKFKQRDFLEEIPFDALVIENGDQD